MILSLFGLAALACTQASYPTDYQVYIDPDLGDRVEDVLNVLDDWAGKTGATFHVTMGVLYCKEQGCDEGYITIHQVPIEQLYQIGHSTSLLGTTVAELPYNGWADVYVPPGFLVETLRHEVGHSLGLEHTVPGDLMCANISCAAPDITCDDVHQYQQIRHQPLETCTQ